MANIKELKIDTVSYALLDEDAHDEILQLTGIVTTINNTKSNKIPIIDLT